MTSKSTIYDFVIVGSGIGGLISSVLLAMEGHSVLVLEKNHQIGGSLQVFSRDKCVFDTGVHYVGSLDKGENLYQIFKYVGILDDLKMQRLDQEQFDVYRFEDGKTYRFGLGYEQFKKGLLEDFPNQEKAIDLFCQKVIEVCNSFPLYNLEEDSPSNYIDNPEILSENAFDFVDSITTDEKLKSILLANGPLYAAEKEKTPLYVLALITNSYIKGSYRFINGGSQIAKLLTKKLREYGGEILKHQEVVSANYENGSVVSVVTKTNDEFYGKTFISNTHPKATIKIFGEDHFRIAFKNRVSKLKNTISSFMVYISLKKDSFPYYNYNFYEYRSYDVLKAIDYTPESWPEIIFCCTPTTVNQGEFAESLSVMTYMDYSEVEQWADSFNTISDKSQRSIDYENFKKEKVEKILTFLEERFPGIKGKINNIYSSTPLTYRDYIGTEDGSLYGIKKDVKSIMNSTINSKTKIPNLFLTGQNLIFHGILGATIGALVTCFNFIDNKTLIDKIRNQDEPKI